MKRYATVKNATFFSLLHWAFCITAYNQLRMRSLFWGILKMKRLKNSHFKERKETFIQVINWALLSSMQNALNHEPREPRSSFITLISETNAFSPVYCDAGNVERTSCIENQGVTGYLLLLEVLDFQSLISSRQVMRIKKNINKGIISRSNTKCSELTSQDLYGRQ